MIKQVARRWRNWWARWRWWWSQDDAPDPIDTVLIRTTIKFLGDRARSFVQQHCGLTLIPAVSGQNSILLILSDSETAFDEPYGQPDLYDILKTFWMAHRISTVIVQEPSKTMLAVRIEEAWVMFRKN